MEDKLTSLILENNLDVKNEALSHNLTSNVIHNITKNRQDLWDMEKKAMMRIIDKLNDLENMYHNYGKNNYLEKDVKKALNEFLTRLHGQLQPFYTYNLYLKYEKAVKKDLQKIKEDIIAQTKDITDPNMQIEKIRNTQIEKDFLATERKWKELKKGFAYENKRISKILSQYEYADYVFLLDSQIENLETALAQAFMPNDFQELMRSWYQRLNRLSEENIYSINDYKQKYKEYCNKYGVEDKIKNKKERAFLLLKLFNPNINFIFDGKELFIANMSKLQLPNGYVYDAQKDLIKIDSLEETIVLNVVHDYNNDKFLASLRKNNPGAKIYMTKENGENVLRSSLSIEQLQLPIGFDAEKDEVTGQIIITNAVNTSKEALKFNFKQLQRPKEVPGLTVAPKEMSSQIEAPKPRDRENEVQPQQAENLEFSNQPKKVVGRHLKSKKANPHYRKAMGMLNIAGHLTASSLLSLTTGGTFIAQKVVQVVGGLTKLVDMLTAKMVKASKEAFHKEIDQSVNQINALKKETIDKARTLDYNIVEMLKQREEKATNVATEYDLEDILAEFRGR